VKKFCRNDKVKGLSRSDSVRNDFLATFASELMVSLLLGLAHAKGSLRDSSYCKRADTYVPG